MLKSNNNCAPALNRKIEKNRFFWKWLPHTFIVVSFKHQENCINTEENHHKTIDIENFVLSFWN